QGAHADSAAAGRRRARGQRRGDDEHALRAAARRPAAERQGRDPSHQHRRAAESTADRTRDPAAGGAARALQRVPHDAPSRSRAVGGRRKRPRGVTAMRSIRTVATFKLGFWAGLMAAAAFMRRAVPSRGGEESDELDLVAIMNGIELKSRATAFRGGSMLAWFGGIAVDLKDAELAPDARLDVRTLFGGIAIRTPPTWRVESTVRALAGGVDV